MLTIHHLGLWVKDLARSDQFYHQIMGFDKQYDYRIPSEIMSRIFGREVACQVAVYRRDEVALELFQPDGKMTDPDQVSLSSGINHFSLKVPDKRVFCQEVKEKGAQLIEVPRGDGCIYFIQDPDGILIEIKEK